MSYEECALLLDTCTAQDKILLLLRITPVDGMSNILCVQLLVGGACTQKSCTYNLCGLLRELNGPLLGLGSFRGIVLALRWSVRDLRWSKWALK